MVLNYLNGCHLIVTIGNRTKGPFTPRVSIHVAMTPATQLSLTTMESLENGVATHFGVTPL